MTGPAGSSGTEPARAGRAYGRRGTIRGMEHKSRRYKDGIDAAVYVMVPVPLELAASAKQFLMEMDMRARAAERGTKVDAEAVVEMVAVLNPRCREALSVVSEAALNDKPPTLRELAASIHRTEYETMGVVQELNDLIWAAFGPLISIVSTAAPEGRPGEINWDGRKVIVWKVLAEAVVTVEQELTERA